MSGLNATGPLLRLALRLDRVRLSVWVVLLGLTPVATAANYQQLYPTQSDLDKVSGIINDPSLVALNGPLFGVNIGGLTAWKIGATEFILIAVMSVLTVVRHTRTEEETGRQELVSAGVVGRFAPLTAALATVALANAAIAVLIVLTMVGVGLSATGAIALGLAVALTGMVFGAIAAVTAQLTGSGRSATGIAMAVLGAAFLLHAVGDTGPVGFTWASPIGWAMRVRPYGGEQWWVLGLLVVAFAVLSGLAYAFVARRDIGAGLLPQRAGRAEARGSLRNPFALAWRLQRGVLIGWVVAMFISGAVLGGAAKTIGSSTGINEKMSEILARMGGSGGLADVFLATCFGLIGFTSAAYTVQATLRLRAEESGGRLEPLLATPVGRTSWVLSHAVFAWLGTAVLLAAAGLGAGLSYGGQIGDVGGQLGRAVAGALVQVPSAWVLAGLGLALFGLVPRLTGLTWAALVVFAVLLELGALFGLDQRVIDVSPFAHAPKVPAAAFTATPLVWLSVIAVALAAAGLAGFRRRDIG
jgi:ABC-2 type transport system permease protein